MNFTDVSSLDQDHPLEEWYCHHCDKPVGNQLGVDPDRTPPIMYWVPTYIEVGMDPANDNAPKFCEECAALLQDDIISDHLIEGTISHFDRYVG